MISLPPPRALVFDLDGTLVDSHAGISASIDHMLRTHGFGPPSVEARERALSLPLAGLVETLTGTDDPARVGRYAATYLEHYVENMVASSNPFPGVAEMLDSLLARGLSLAVLTNKTERNAMRIVEGRLGRALFHAFVGSVPERPNKPDPAGALLVARELGLAPAECWLVGDSRIDVATARAAGMRAVGARWGISAALAAHLEGADHVLEKPMELIELIDAARGVAARARRRPESG